jgi:lactoylglutathione lyase
MEKLAIETCGLILGTEKFDACVAFYRDVVGLPVWFEKPGIVCLRFGNGYLMIETGGIALGRLKQHNENPTIIRFNVRDVDACAKMLEDRGVAIERKSFSWGEVATFSDPDGNPCELKNADDPFFS